MVPRCGQGSASAGPILLLLLLALSAAAHASPSSRRRIPADINQWVYTPNASDPQLLAKDLKPPRRFWDRSLLDQAHIVENYVQLKPLLDKLNAGQPITVVSVGDSISSAYGGNFHRDEQHRKSRVKLVDPQLAADHNNPKPLRWLRSFMQQVNASWPHYDHILINLAKPGSNFRDWAEGECLEEYFPPQADLVIVEHLPALEGPNMTVTQAERLLHRLMLHLQGPLPAIIFLSMYPILSPAESRPPNTPAERCIRDIKLCNTLCPTYFLDQPDPKYLYSEAELHTHAVASYYGFTSLSHPALIHALMRDRLAQRVGLNECEALSMIYSDPIHPDMHGRMLMADMMVNLLDLAQEHLDAMEGTRSTGLQQHPLPVRPMEPKSVTLYRSHCLYSAAKVHEGMDGKADLHTMRMLKTEGWRFVEYDGEARKYKPGWVATTPGATLWIEVPLSLVADVSTAQARRSTLEDGVVSLNSNGGSELRWHLAKVARKLGQHAVTQTHAPDAAWVRQVRLAELSGSKSSGLAAEEAATDAAPAPHHRRSLAAGGSIAFTMHMVFLVSYQHMGKAKLTCLEGCQCSNQYNGHNANMHSSLPQIHAFNVVAPDSAGRCILEVQVMPETDSGEHKVKVIQMALGSYMNMTAQITKAALATRAARP